MKRIKKNESKIEIQKGLTKKELLNRKYKYKLLTN